MKRDNLDGIHRREQSLGHWIRAIECSQRVSSVRRCDKPFRQLPKLYILRRFFQLGRFPMCRRVTSACNDDTRLQGFLANVALKERAFSSVVLELFRGEYIFVFSLSETLNNNIFFRFAKRLRSLCDRINPLQFSFGDYTEKFCFFIMFGKSLYILYERINSLWFPFRDYTNKFYKIHNDHDVH